MKYLIILFALVFIIRCENSNQIPTHKIQLSAEWTFKQTDKMEWFPATVPGVVHTDLLANQLIEDPYWENNELELQWIENESWSYKNEFLVDEKQLEFENITIDFEGLDTYAKVYLNGSLLLKADNMFRSWKKDIKENLIIGKNELLIVFESPIAHNKAIVQSANYKLPSGNEKGDIQVSSYTRKAAYHFGWDWGPRFVTAGIWRPVSINSWNGVEIENVQVQTISISDSLAKLRFIIQIDAKIEENNQLFIQIENELKPIASGQKTIQFDINVKNPKLWECNGLGDPYIYEYPIKLLHGENCIDSLIQKVGIRTIELINEPDKIGTSFYFKLNGKPIFMKGANYIPQDLFLPSVDSARYIKLINQIKELNINMIRVWGGGIYERDFFYDLCDQNGILVWQDFMFAGSMYPGDKAFKANVSEEVKQNIIRLRNHPCIALWCGNNEIEVAWNNWGWQKQFDYSTTDSVEIWHNYLSIFDTIIPQIIDTYNPLVNYTRTSPLSNWGTPENFNHSSMHYWGVWHGKDNFDDYVKNIGRFMVEYGFQSYPSMETIKLFTKDSSRYLQSAVMKNRQKSYVGNGLIQQEIERYYAPSDSFEDFIMKSQKVQSIALGKAIEAHLAAEPHCMGTLFWQLNDCWPGPSWSIIDYYGNRKIAYDTVKTKFKN
ncbi:glycoside hydrolase family 2 protein [Crocinitomix catalasitica]|uniref:glycoside hydrolase family 2 protein n=1 Tax=Crocinitomix catalasitica TaxID=184607 RepID=UPI000687B272|nr:sugar-binding domain-containing protein [Crocinitomix catalasitica]